MRFVVGGVVCLAVSLAAQQPQQPAPTFRSGVSLVTIDVTVLDRDGKPVPGLTPDDLEIKLNGKVQPIRAFAFVQAAAADSTAPASAVAAPTPAHAVPPASPSPAAIAPAPFVARAPVAPRATVSNAGRSAPEPESVVSEPQPAAAAAPPREPSESRVFVIVVDDLSFSPLRGRAMFNAAQRFLDRVPASDPVGFTTTSGLGAVNPSLDRASVREALAKVMGQFNDPRGLRKSGPVGASTFGSMDSPLGINESIDIARGDESLLKDVIARECFNGDRTAMLSMSLPQVIGENSCASDVQTQARQVAGITQQNKGRQIEGVMSVIKAMKSASGIRHLILLSDGLPVSREVDELNPLVRAAADAGVQLSVLLADPDISVTDEGRRGTEGGAPPQADPGQSRRRREDDMLMVNGLQTMTDMLGGSFYRVVGSADPFFDRVIVSSSAVYRLGVEVPAGAKPGDTLRVAVSSRRPGVSARANRFSVAALPAATAPAPTPAPTPAVSPRAPVAMSLDDTLKGAIDQNRLSDDVPLRIAAYVRRSASVPGQVDVSVSVAIPETTAGPISTYLGLVDTEGSVRTSKRVLDAAGPSGYTATYLMPLAPGDYRVRYAAADARGTVGTIELPLHVSLAPMGAFTASDVLTWYADEEGKPQLFALEDLPPGAGVLNVSLELYPAGAMPAKEPVVHWTLTPEGASDPIDEFEDPAFTGAGFFRADADFSLAALPPGRYVVRATLVVDGKPAGSRAAVVVKR
jgi:VWFA-related protein